jgi:hypothetical protein
MQAALSTKFDQIEQDEQARLLSIMRQIAVRDTNDDQQLESEFVFTFNESGAVLYDKYFFSLTSDDYGELWINRAVDCLALANERGVVLPDLPNSRATPRTIFVEDGDSDSLRAYRVVFDDNELQSSGKIPREYGFTIEGGKGNVRTIAGRMGHTSQVGSKRIGLSHPLQRPI